MSEDRYGELVEARRAERDANQRERGEILAAQRRVQQIYFHRRNALFKAITDRAAELEHRFPDLGQLFVNTFGDSLKMSKSKHPSGYLLMAFDIERFAVPGAFKFQNVEGFEFEFQIVSPEPHDETVQLWADGKSWTDEQIVTFIFDSFMPHIA